MSTIENPKKIAFVGTSCVGKTTIIDHYQKKYEQNPKVALVREAAREYFTANPHIPIDERFGVEPQGAIQRVALENEKRAQESGAEILICDRSVLDAVAYVRGHGDKEGSQELLKRVESWVPTYDAILLLDPADIPYQTDGIRQESPDVRQRNHEAFLEVFMEAVIDYELLSGTEEERIQRVDEILQS
jgi:nicotinamide riboside kinase